MRARHFTRRAWLFALATLIAAATLPPSRGATQATLVAIVHPSNPVSSMSLADVRNIYLGRVTFWRNNVPVQAYARPASSPAGREFLRILGMTPSRFRHHWQTRQLSGQGVAPAIINGFDELANRIAGSRGGIGVAMQGEGSASARVKLVPIR